MSLQNRRIPSIGRAHGFWAENRRNGEARSFLAQPAERDRLLAVRIPAIGTGAPASGNVVVVEQNALQIAALTNASLARLLPT